MITSLWLREKIYSVLLTLNSVEILSMVYSRTEILQKEVFFIDTLDNLPEEKLLHLKAVVFC